MIVVFTEPFLLLIARAMCADADMWHPSEAVLCCTADGGIWLYPADRKAPEGKGAH